jgi:hypothetical protein
MSSHATTSKNSKALGGVFTAAVASSAFFSAALGSAPAANATCASFFGIGNSASCTSTLTTVAIAVGANASANAGGWFGTAIAVGDDSAATNNSTGILNISAAFGDHAVAAGGGLASLAVAVGDNGQAAAGTLAAIPEIGNSAINIGSSSPGTINSVTANGIVSNAVNGLGNAMTLNATGVLTHVGTLGGNGSVVHTDPNSLTIASMGIHAFGTGNDVTVRGPLAVAISVFQTKATVTKDGPGVNLDGISVGAPNSATSAAALRSRRSTVPSSTGATTKAPSAGAASQKAGSATSHRKRSN